MRVTRERQSFEVGIRVLPRADQKKKTEAAAFEALKAGVRGFACAMTYCRLQASLSGEKNVKYP